MKGLACSECVDLRLLSNRDRDPVSCRCENVTGWWIDGRAGVARYSAQRPAYAYGVGLNNQFLLPALHLDGLGRDGQWRDLHDIATNAPNHLFDRARRNCWVVIFKPGNVSDVEWANNEERRAVGLAPYPAGHVHAQHRSTS